jgi:transposase
MIVAGSFSMKPDSEALFVFCNKKRDRIKILEWASDGFWVYFKRLYAGHFPWSVDGIKAINATSEELAALTNIAKLVSKLRGKDTPGEFAM